MRMIPMLALAAMPAGAAAEAEEIRISMAGAAYAPAVVEAKIGDTLVFDNDDDVAHDVFIPTVGFAVDLGRQDPLTQTALSLGRLGMFDVECVLHPGMHARVVVGP